MTVEQFLISLWLTAAVTAIIGAPIIWLLGGPW
jgi:hypothetical protein